MTITRKERVIDTAGGCSRTSSMGESTDGDWATKRGGGGAIGPTEGEKWREAELNV